MFILCILENFLFICLDNPFREKSEWVAFKSDLTVTIQNLTSSTFCSHQFSSVLVLRDCWDCQLMVWKPWDCSLPLLTVHQELGGRQNMQSFDNFQHSSLFLACLWDLLARWSQSFQKVSKVFKLQFLKINFKLFHNNILIFQPYTGLEKF